MLQEFHNNNYICFNAIIPAGQGSQFLLYFALAISVNHIHPLLSSQIVPDPSLPILLMISLVKPSSFSQIFQAP